MSSIGETLVTSRSFSEYRAMFALSENDLTTRILDCPAGAAGFVAEVNALGGDATACDMVYSARTVDELAVLTRAEVDRGNRYVRAHADDYVWTFFADADEHQDSRQRAAQDFVTDIRRHPERYVAGRLPSLPFADSTFDIVLGSHLLFSYSDRLDLAFHLDAVTELVRVARGEVRIFPLVSVGPTPPCLDLPLLLENLNTIGIETRIVEVDYEFQRGGNRMLVCSDAPHSHAP